MSGALRSALARGLHEQSDLDAVVDVELVQRTRDVRLHAWMAVVSLHLFAGIAQRVDTARALGPMPEEVLSPTQWAHAAATALALWMLLALLTGIWRITRQEVTA